MVAELELFNDILSPRVSSPNLTKVTNLETLSSEERVNDAVEAGSTFQ